MGETKAIRVMPEANRSRTSDIEVTIQASVDGRQVDAVVTPFSSGVKMEGALGKIVGLKRPGLSIKELETQFWDAVEGKDSELAVKIFPEVKSNRVLVENALNEILLRTKNKKMLFALLDAGLDINTRVPAGYWYSSILTLAIGLKEYRTWDTKTGKGEFDFVFTAGEIRDLLKRGANPEGTENRFDYQPVMEAASKNRMDVLRILIEEYHASARASNGDTYYAIHSAAKQDLPEPTEYLLQHGADPNAKLCMLISYTPLDLALQHGAKKTPDILRKYGGKTTTR